MNDCAILDLTTNNLYANSEKFYGSPAQVTKRRITSRIWQNKKRETIHKTS